MTWSVETPGVVTFPDGRRVRARGLRHGDLAGESAELGVYLLGRAPAPTAWPSWWIRWPDFRLPTDRQGAIATLSAAYERSAVERVELACGGGIGRTGTALAVMAVLAGVPAEDAVAWTRAHHHPRAVETPWQRRWVRTLDPHGGGSGPR